MDVHVGNPQCVDWLRRRVVQSTIEIKRLKKQSRLRVMIRAGGALSIGAFIAMDEQAVRGLLKEQFDGFTSQLAALTLELQTTKTALAGQHVQGGNDHGIPRSMRIDVPKFNESNPHSWIFAINEYFSLLETTLE
nr:prolyl oligopeptidase family protein [Tanacetum cinerariifolium]